MECSLNMTRPTKLLLSNLVALGIAIGLLWLAPWPVNAGGVVGDGTPQSCTEAALDAALAGGGLVTFNCGANPYTLTVTAQKVIAANTTMDGGGLIVLSGGGTTRVFSVSVGIGLTLTNLFVSNGATLY
jgi:hypothetical protein